MSSFAYFRLPGQSQYLCVRSRQSPIELSSYAALDATTSGYVLAPFHLSSAHPLLVITADFVQICPLTPVLMPQISISKQQADEDIYRADFRRFHAVLQMHTLQKVVLARQLQVELNTHIDPLALFHQACALYPHAFVSLVHTPKSGTWLMATPETLLAKLPTGTQWYTMALAGTMKQPGPWTDKNCEEQRLVADYIEACLTPHSEQIKRSEPYVRQAAQLYHRCSDFFLILREEHLQRAYYSGFSGPLNVHNTTHFFVSLRCMQLFQRRCTLYAGGGLLPASDEQSEWNETALKLNTMLNVLQSKSY